ncbi:MAG: glutamine--tRNA ligase, partial [Firmicutes bacterium]|nr:glutamine--tRNA ligase [Bacillota bacterium]
WVSAVHGIDAEVRLYDYLFQEDEPTPDSPINPESLIKLSGCKAEPSLAKAVPGERFQFLRQGYFCVDQDSAPGKLVFNRTVGLKDSWAGKK